LTTLAQALRRCPPGQGKLADSQLVEPQVQLHLGAHAVRSVLIREGERSLQVGVGGLGLAQDAPAHALGHAHVRAHLLWKYLSVRYGMKFKVLKIARFSLITLVVPPFSYFPRTDQGAQKVLRGGSAAARA
jgi:hypothetical protein